MSLIHHRKVTISIPIYFVFPGDLDTPTGGYHYDRRLITELRKLGFVVDTLALPDFDALLTGRHQQTLQAVFSALPDGSVVVVDGLAFGVMDEVAMAEARRLKLVALCHHPLALESGIGEQQRAALLASERRALDCARATLVTSRHTKQILVDQFSVPAETITVALPGTEKVPFAPCTGDPIRLLTIASLIPRKAHDVLIEALASIAHLPWQARFVGGLDHDIEWTSVIRNLIDQNDLVRRINLVGAVSDTRGEYQQADLFVLPSRFEGYGMVFAEALAAGLPIVACRAGAVPEVVPKEAGILVAPDDSDALRLALQQLLTSESLRKGLQDGARRAASRLSDWNDCAKTVATRLEQVHNA